MVSISVRPAWATVGSVTTGSEDSTGASAVSASSGAASAVAYVPTYSVEMVLMAATMTVLVFPRV